MKLNDVLHEIYSRQMMMKEIGETGQLKLAAASVLVAGCGGLGASVLYYLTAAGVGHLGLCDGDTVSLSNLNRQILFTASDAGKPKASTAKERLTALNPLIKATVYDKPVDEILAKKVIKDYDVIVDCLDNFESRFVLNDICVEEEKPLIHAGVGEFYGQLMTIIPGKSSCLRCLFPNGILDKVSTAGIIGTTPGVIGTMQALEVIKYLLGLPVYTEGLIAFDTLALSLEKVGFKQAEDCICRKGNNT